MTDFESRLRDSLRDRADDAPIAAGLADGARRRLRRRRTAMATAGVVAAVVVVVPFLFVDREPEATGIATDPSSPPPATATATDDGLRTESWHDLTLEVPDDWGFGNPTAYCTGGEDPRAATPSVGRPLDITPMIMCDPGQGYGVTVGSSATSSFEPASGDVWQYSAKGVDAPSYPDGTWLSFWYDKESVIRIATPDRDLTEQILGSVRRIDGVDDNGCAPVLGEAEAGPSDGTDSMSVCRYDPEEGLEWSRRLDVGEAQELDEAVQAAPMQDIDYDCPAAEPVSRTVILEGGSYLATVVTDATCEGYNGIFLSGVVRQVTDRVRLAVERPLTPQ